MTKKKVVEWEELYNKENKSVHEWVDKFNKLREIDDPIIQQLENP